MTRIETIALLLCVSLPSFMLQFDANLVPVALPSLARDLGVDFTGVEWVVTAYTVAFAAFVLPAGGLGDRYGRKHVLIFGLALFSLSSLVSGLSQTLALLVTARACEGLGAALQLGAGLAILQHSFHGHERTRAFAVWASMIGLGIAGGPLVGGLVTAHLGWHYGFFVNVPIGAGVIALALRYVPHSDDPQMSKLDLPGLVSFSGFLFLAAFVLISGNRHGWRDPALAWESLGALLCLAAFVAVERRTDHPMLELSLFRRPTFLGASIAGLAFAASVLTTLVYLPIYFQAALGFNPFAAGLAMLPLTAMIVAVPHPVARWLAPHLSGRAQVVLGLALVAAGVLWLALTARDGDYATMVGGMVLVGLGAGILNGEVVRVGLIVIPRNRAGMGSGIGGTVRFTGLLIGFAGLGVVLSGRIATALAQHLPRLSPALRAQAASHIASGHFAAATGVAHSVAAAAFAEGYRAVFLGSAMLAGLAALAAWLLIRRTETLPHKPA